MDEDNITILVLLDLSAAFHTVYYSILIKSLEQRFGITNTAFNWFKSNLYSRKQVATINAKKSDKHLEYGVPQRYVLGPMLFTMYTSPLGDMVRIHQIQFHL